MLGSYDLRNQERIILWDLLKLKLNKVLFLIQQSEIRYSTFLVSFLYNPRVLTIKTETKPNL